MISFIETTNFKKLDCAHLNFTEGTNLIVGDNGYGKTTIFSAVKFALYGVSGIDSEKENIPTWGSKNCKVKVGFTGKFLIVRTLRDCKIYEANENGELLEDSSLKVAEGSTPCTSWVKDHYGLDSDMFDIFNMALQGETSAIVTLGATKLNQVVENYSGVGILDDVIKSLTQSVSSLKGAASTYEYTDTSELENSLKVSELEVSELKVQETATSQTLDNLNKLRETSVTKLNNVVNDNLNIQKVKDSVAKALALTEVLSPKLNAANQQRKELETKISGIGCPIGLRSQVENFETNLTNFNKASELHTQYEELLEETKADILKYDSLVSREEVVAAEKTRLSDELSIISGKVESAKAEYLKTITLVSDAQAVVDHGACSKCHREFEDFNRDQAELSLMQARTKKTNACDVLTELKKQSTAISNRIESLPESRRADLLLEEAKKLEQSYTSNISKIETEWESFDEEIVEDALASAKGDLKLYDTTSTELRQVITRITEDQTDYDEANSIVSCAGSKATAEIVDVTSYQNAVNEVTNDIAVISPKFTELQVAITKLASENTASTKELNNLVSGNEKLKNLESDLDKHSRLTKYLRTTRTDYMGSVWASILGAASGFINKTTKGWITEIGRNSNGKFTFTENGIVGVVKGDASGAQKEFIGVALHIGLGMALQGDNALLMLDEPTAGMTEANADKLATGLLGVHGQKIVITHRQSERLTAANIINV